MDLNISLRSIIEENNGAPVLNPENQRNSSQFHAGLVSDAPPPVEEDTLASKEAEIARQRDQILKLEAEVSALRGISSSSLSNSSPNKLQLLEKDNKELVNMCNDMEEELRKGQKDYDILYDTYNTVVKEHERKQRQLEDELKEAKECRNPPSGPFNAAIPSSSSPEMRDEGNIKAEDCDLKKQLEIKTFYLDKEKEVVLHLEEIIHELRQEIENLKEKQYLREKFMEENYEAVIEKLREEQQRMQQKLREQHIAQDLRSHSKTVCISHSTLSSEERKDAGKEEVQTEASESDPDKLHLDRVYGNHSSEGTKDQTIPLGPIKQLNSSFVIAPLRDVERRAYASIIHRLQMEVLELRKMAFILPSFCCSDSADYQSKKICFNHTDSRKSPGAPEIEWAKKELLEVERTIPECCMKVMNFTNPTSQKKSTRAMFANVL